VDGDIEPRTRRRRNPAPELPLVEIERGGGLPADPRRFREQEAKVNAIIQFAARVRDWPLLSDAVDAKIEDQREFVRWWDEAVGVRLHAGTELGAERRSTLTKDQAEHDTEITHQQVSRWRKSIRDVAKYREQLIVAARRKADLSAAANHRAEGILACDIAEIAGKMKRRPLPAGASGSMRHAASQALAEDYRDPDRQGQDSEDGQPVYGRVGLRSRP
jgi:hypothetical protein